MAEVNGPKFSVNQINFNGISKSQQEVTQEAAGEDTPQLSDFSDPKAEALGRSMLFKGADDVNQDLKALLKEPQIADNSDEMFEAAYLAAQDAGIANPYEEAATFATGSMQ